MPEEAKKQSSILGMLPGIGQAVAQVGSWLGIGEKRQDRRQLKQQGKLNAQQEEANRRMAEFNQGLQMDMWNKTNYEAQVGKMKEAGINPALMYGGVGAGGSTQSAMAAPVEGGSAANAAMAMQANTGQAQGMAMLPAQIELIKAQTENVKADTAKKSGVDTRVGEATATNAEFHNELNKEIGLTEMANKYRNEAQKIEQESQKYNLEFEAWMAGNFQGGEYAADDKNSPLAKGIRAGLDKAVEDLKGTKLTNDATRAGNIVKEFEARLAEQGIHPQSPWWTKLITDMLQKAGIIDMAKAIIK